MLIRLLQWIYTIYTAIIFILLVVITVPFFLLFTWLFKERAFISVMVLCRSIAYGLMVFCGIIYRFHRNAKVDKHKTYVLIANHRSNLDAPVAAISFSGKVRYLAKKELLKIPVLGQIFAVTTVNVDRSSSESRKKSVEQLKKHLRNGDNIFLFVEGTRNKTKDEPMIAFKDGAFSVAIQTQTPILPMIFLHTDKLMPNDKPLMRPGIIDIYHLDPVDVTGMTESDIGPLKQKVREIMVAKYIELTALQK